MHAHLLAETKVAESLAGWAIAFATGMYALYKDPSGHADQELLQGALFPCSDWDEGAQP